MNSVVLGYILIGFLTWMGMIVWFYIKERRYIVKGDTTMSCGFGWAFGAVWPLVLLVLFVIGITELVLRAREDYS